MEILEKVEQLKTEIDSLRPLDPEVEARIMQKLRLDWNYHSNKLEGNTYSYGETKMLLMKELTAGGKPKRDAEEITGHDQAITFIFDSIKSDEPLTEVFIRHLHKLILVKPFWADAKTADGQPTKRLIKVGEYKTEPNHVETQSGAIFRFAEPIETPAKMQELVEWFRGKIDTADTNAILLAAEFHYRFVLIHPFDDGNGRLARLLMNFVLMKYGFPPVIIKNEDKDNYIAVLEQADFEILGPFVEFVAQNLVHSIEIMIRGARGEKIEELDDIDKEIALFEHQVRSFGKRIEIRRNREAVFSVLESSISRLSKSFFLKFRVFDRFYVENHARLFINEVPVLGEYDNALHYARQEFENTPGDTISAIKLQYVGTGFNQLGFGDFQYESTLTINFELTKFTVVARMTGEKIEKLYTEQLSETEIQELVEGEKRKHFEVIKSKVAEMSGKS
ncbi:MAG: Fic family protein [Pyrinomonadaceae bacterium]